MSDKKMLSHGIYGNRRPVLGEIVAVLHVTRENRSLKLTESLSRALLKNEIHEIMISDNPTLKPGMDFKRFSAIAFFEVQKGGLVVVGDELSIKNKPLGSLAGFNLVHMPNHMNIVVKTDSLASPEIKIGDEIRISRAPEASEIM